MSLLPDDWSDYSTTCDKGHKYHASEYGCGQCVECAVCGDVVDVAEAARALDADGEQVRACGDCESLVQCIDCETWCEPFEATEGICLDCWER